MGKITIDQSHQVMATLAVNTDWESIDFKNSGLQDFIVRNQKEVGRQFTAFLKNGGKIIVKEPRSIKIDRSIPFDLVTFLNKGCSIKEQDERALVLTEIDSSKIQLETMFKPGEIWVNGQERLERLKMAGHIRLDAKIFQTLWEDQNLIPEKWKEKTNGNTTYIFFDGTVLRDSIGHWFVLYLCWDGGEWEWGYDWLAIDFGAYGLSVVLAS